MKILLILFLIFLVFSGVASTGSQNVTLGSQFEIQPGHSALWYNPDQTGHGLSVYLLEDNRIIVFWYVYDNNALPLWLLGVGTHDGFTATLDVNQFDGAQFPPNFNTTDVNSKDWGTFTLSFSDCDNGLFQWTPLSGNGFTGGEMNTVRLTNTLGLACNNTTNKSIANKRLHNDANNQAQKSLFAMNSGSSALWYNSNESGHGINVYMLPDNRIVVIWYVYDNNRKPVWLLGTGSHDGSKATLDVVTGAGAIFPPNFNPDDVVFENWGSFELEFSDCNNGIFKWLPASANGFNAGEMSVVRLTNTLGLSCTDPIPQTDAVQQQEFIGNLDYKVLAANDLGMHCADLDNQIFSILPPFNVVHAQVIKRGDNPTLMTPTENPDISVVYSATFNPNDPILDDNNPTMPAFLNPPSSDLIGTNRAEISINSTSQNDLISGVIKSNFWNSDSASGHSIGFENYDNIFFGLLDPDSIIFDMGLPVPDSMLLPDCLVNPATCSFGQQKNPGINNPFYNNETQAFNRFDAEVNFFSSVLPTPLGEVINDSNWWSADGIPILPIDDAGRSNPYPMMRIQAKINNNTVASTDIVIPVASEADCQNCHAQLIDCADIDVSPLIQSDSCNESAISPTLKTQTIFEVASLENAPGFTVDQQLLNAAKINILRLHDVKHGDSYPSAWGSCNAAENASNSNSWNDNCLNNKTPIQCSQCHYSPALDLAQLGPTDSPEHQVFQESVGLSMSSVMHKFHGQYTDLFPDMPAPNDTSRLENATSHGFSNAAPGQSVTEYVLQESCYQCHPGKRSQCLRGAMASAGVVCQDCHGEMTDVGHDFTTGGSRVPWASEPKCQSCHTGDDSNKNHPAGAIVANDGIRLLQAYVNDANSPIQSQTSRYAENENLFRLSGNSATSTSEQGHSGIMCKGCHGSTHAIWPNANINANDNVAAIQLQGHSGTITECGTCHTDSLGLSQDGPHGLHEISPVSQNNGQIDPNVVRTSWNRNHEDVNDRSGCKDCHGSDGLGTALSKTSADRSLVCDDVGRNGCQRVDVNGRSRKFVFVPMGTEISCNLCHENEIDDDD